MKMEARAVLAVTRSAFLTMRRYPLLFGALLILPLYQLVLPSLLLGVTFLVHGRSVGLEKAAGTADVAGFLFLGGLATSLIFAVFWGTAWNVVREMQSGTMETLWMTRSRPESFVLGQALAGISISLLAGILLLVMGQLIFGARYLAGIVAALPAMLILIIALVGMAYLITAAVLILREANFLIDMTSYLLMVGSGVMFPLTVFPGAIRLVAFALPPTFALDILRVDALHSRPLLPMGWEYLILAGSSVLLVVLGRWVFHRTERRLRIRGTLGFH